MFKIVTKENCAYCTSAKYLLNKHKIPYNESKLNENGLTRELILDSYPSARTFPIIEHNGMYIGGYAELVKYLEEHLSLDNGQNLIQE